MLHSQKFFFRPSAAEAHERARPSAVDAQRQQKKRGQPPREFESESELGQPERQRPAPRPRWVRGAPQQ